MSLSGVGLGVLMALAFSWGLRHFPLVELPDVYMLNAITVSFDWVVYVWATVLSLALAVLAAWVPARLASRTEPVDGIAGRVGGR